MAIPLLFVIFFIQYWIDKFNLFTRSSLSFTVNFLLSRGALKLFELSLFLFALGNFIFSRKTHDNQDSHSTYINIASLIISTLYCTISTLAPAHIEKRIFGSYE